ncbi:FAD-dependent tricarballylate dehydrogenase TcuA [Agromyces sp. NPDC049794]|uniref:FAD-dependent tricarballylate dehydrogenase TcuA n=1 Tax=unclassified Agromyces TaxID=2639701 RepID=UPI0033E4618D
MSVNDPQCDADVIVIGAGNAAFAAALSAAERGRSVIMLERAEKAMAGGNSFFTAGATRMTHDGFDSLLDLVEPDERHDRTEVPAYTTDNYRSDLERVTEGRNDPELTEVLVAEISGGLRWLHSEHGMRYRLMYERQAYERADGTFLFWGGLHVGNVGGGEGMIADYSAAAERAGIEIRYEHHVMDFVIEDGRVVGVEVALSDGTRTTLRGASTVLAAGGFEANADLREKYLGPGWSKAVVRGTPYNTGELLLRALDLGADRGGDWSTCHSTAWDAWFPANQSNRALTNRLTRQSYPLGIVVNKAGKRFIDEGADYRNYTYAKYGREILRQPESVAFQVFDSAVRPMLRAEEYDMPGISVAVAETLDDLAHQLGVDRAGFTETVNGYNTSIDRSIPVDPTVKDGAAATTVPVKSNWAYPIEEAPFFAYPVTCGITFTFGGLKTDVDGRVLTAGGAEIPGLLACGESLGGLFSQNYPGGSGLAAGIVFGRRAGAIA